MKRIKKILIKSFIDTINIILILSAAAVLTYIPLNLFRQEYIIQGCIVIVIELFLVISFINLILINEENYK